MKIPRVHQRKMGSSKSYKVVLVLCACVVGSSALTSQEASQFKARTGLVQSPGTVSVTDTGQHYVIRSNGLPDHPSGPFPSRHNPNVIVAQNYNFIIPKIPKVAMNPGCLPMGAIGVSVNGVPLFNPYTAEGYNAVEGEHREIFDDCDGHPAPGGQYHYHMEPGCISTNTSGQLIGVALDGFAIYGPVDENGRVLTTADLDFCHGRYVNGNYQYHITRDFPYVLGCFFGEYNSTQRPGARMQGGRRPMQGGRRHMQGGQSSPGQRNTCFFANATDQNIAKTSTTPKTFNRSPVFTSSYVIMLFGLFIHGVAKFL